MAHTMNELMKPFPVQSATAFLVIPVQEVPMYMKVMFLTANLLLLGSKENISSKLYRKQVK